MLINGKQSMHKTMCNRKLIAIVSWLNEDKKKKYWLHSPQRTLKYAHYIVFVELNTQMIRGNL